MTICNEYVREMTRTTRRDSVFRKDLESAGWGLRNECWVKTLLGKNRICKILLEESEIQLVIQHKYKLIVTIHQQDSRL